MYNMLSNATLHIETVKASKTEKATTVVLLKYLAGVASRMVFLDFGHSTLQKYVTSELGYSEPKPGPGFRR